MSLKQFIEKEVLGTASVKTRTVAALETFGKFLLQDTNTDWATIISKFATDRPWTFWDEQTIDHALQILESDIDRTVDALNLRSKEVGIAIDNLFRISPATLDENSLDASKSSDLLRLSVEFHPEYLRRNEHIFVNLICFYWSVLKKGGVEGKFDIHKAIALINSRNLHSLHRGYDDRVRNGIAHGQIVFSGLGSIQYGHERANYSLASSEFLKIFDDLWRTCNGLTLGILLFVARNETRIQAKGIHLPPSLIAYIASGLLERESLSVIGAIESKTGLAGKQLHLFVKTSMLAREWVLFDCIRISASLIKHGATDYNRFIFDIDQGKKLTSQVITLPAVLRCLLDDPETPLSSFNEAIDQPPLLWFNESRFSLKLKTWQEICKSLLRSAWNDLQNQWEHLGIRISDQSFQIIKVKNLSSENDRRIHVYAVLKKSELVDDKEYLKRVIKKIIRRTSKLTVEKESAFRKRRRPLGRPTYVWVSLYRLDGTCRWVTADGWLGGNLIATAEKVFSLRKQPIMEKNPEVVWSGIRFRFSIDTSAYVEAMGELAETISQIGRSDNRTS